MNVQRKIKEYVVLEKIGQGGFASVHKARDHQRNVAIKIVSKPSLSSEGLIDRVRQEIGIHSSLHHPSILPLYSYFEDSDNVYLVLELCQTGNLHQYLSRLQRPLQESEAQTFLVQILDGMLYLQSLQIMHRDLKLSNLLLDVHYNVKIADFGMATQMRTPREKHTTMCGTPNYVSPQVALRKSYGLETDVWSFGIMLYEMVVGQPPFDKHVENHKKNYREDAREIMSRVVDGTYQMPKRLSEECQNLIEQCLCADEKDRIKLKDIPGHPFLARTYHTMHSKKESVDSGQYTQSSGAITRHTKSSGEESEYSRRSNQNVNNYMWRHPPASPPVRMKSNPNDMLQYQQMQLRRQDVPDSMPMLIDPIRPRSDRETRPHTRNGAIKAKHFQRHDSHNSRSSSGRAPSIIRDHSARESFHKDQLPRSNSQGRRNDSKDSGNVMLFPPTPHSDDPCYIASTRSTNSQSGLKRLDDLQRILPCPPTLQLGPPLSSARLKPIRQSTTRAISHILNNGEVCVEFLTKNETVHSVMRVSADGMRITTYECNRTKIRKEPAPVPDRHSSYSYNHLPEDQWKKYICAARFTDAVKANTSKVIYYTDLAKCQLMENGKFQATFHTAAKIVFYQSKVTFQDTGAEYKENACPDCLNNVQKKQYLHAKDTQERCLRHSELEHTFQQPCFPIKLGSAPTVKIKNNQNTENISPSSQWTTANSRQTRKPLSTLNHDYQPLLSKPQNNEERKFNKALGAYVSQDNGDFEMEYLNGSRLKMPEGRNEVFYSKCPSEPFQVFANHSLPPSLLNKMKAVENYKNHHL